MNHETELTRRGISIPQLKKEPDMTNQSPHSLRAQWKDTLLKKTFDVYSNEQGDYQAVKQGITLPGFFFSFLWALFYKIWSMSILLFLAITSLIYLEYYFADVALITLYTGIIDLIIRLFVGINGNKWRRLSIQKKGFTLKESVVASSPDAAIWELLPESIRRELEESPHHAYQLKRDKYSQVIGIIIGISTIGILYSDYGFLRSILPALGTILVTWAIVYAVLFPVGYLIATSLYLIVNKDTKT